MKTESPQTMKRRKIKIEKPDEPAKEYTLWEEVQKYARMIPQTPEPNMGRVAEIRQEIREGTYLQPEMIDELAARLAIRYLKKHP